MKKIDYFEDQYGIHISYSWRTPVMWFMAFFVVVWNLFLLMWYSMASSSGAPLLFFVFPIIHILAGLFLAYLTATKFFNKTHIDVIGDHLTIKHGPIPWFKGNKEINVQDIQQLFVVEKKKQHENGVTFWYNLWVLKQDGSKEDLSSDIEMDAQYALELEQKLETYLGIEDRPVKGAHGNMAMKSNVPNEEPALDLEELKNKPQPDIQPQKRWEDEDLV